MASSDVSHIKNWLQKGQQQGATHTILVACHFEHKTFPIHVTEGTAAAKKKVASLEAEPLKSVDEVYNLTENIETQLAHGRSFTF